MVTILLERRNLLEQHILLRQTCSLVVPWRWRSDLARISAVSSGRSERPERPEETAEIQARSDRNCERDSLVELEDRVPMHPYDVFF